MFALWYIFLAIRSRLRRITRDPRRKHEEDHEGMVWKKRPKRKGWEEVEPLRCRAETCDDSVVYEEDDTRQRRDSDRKRGRKKLDYGGRSGATYGSRGDGRLEEQRKGSQDYENDPCYEIDIRDFRRRKSEARCAKSSKTCSSVRKLRKRVKSTRWYRKCKIYQIIWKESKKLNNSQIVPRRAFQLVRCSRLLLKI